MGPNSVTPLPGGVLGESHWVTVFTPPARADKLSWDASAAQTRGNASYVALCALCRVKLADGTAPDPTLIHDVIATNVKPGCTGAPAKAKCWHMAKSIGLPHAQVSDIAIDPKDPKTIYVSLRQFIVQSVDPNVTGSEKIMVSHDAGDHFTDITGDLPRADAHRVSLRGSSLVVAATDVGVFVSVPGSGHWSVLGTNLPQVPVRSMRLDPTGRYVLAGAYGRGAWVYDFGSAAPGSTKVKGEKVTAGAPGSLPATGTEPTTMFAVALLAMAGVLSRRLKRTP